MALVIQNEAMVGSYVPYERPPQPYTLWTAIPRGLQSFTVAAAQLNEILVGNDALLNLTATLPPNFGYVMVDCNLTITMANAAGSLGWDATYNLNLQNFYRAGGAGLSGNWTQEMLDSAQDASTRTSSTIQPWPSFPMVAPGGSSGILINISTFNNGELARSVGTIDSYISFWQFDLEQIRKFPINSPMPTHPR